MTVEELIKELQGMPMDAEVHIEYTDGEFGDVFNSCIETIFVDPEGDVILSEQGE